MPYGWRPTHLEAIAMTLSPTITFQGMEPSEALRTEVLRHISQLDRMASDLRSCRVLITAAERRHRHGNRYHVHVRVTLDGRELHAGRTPGRDDAHADPYLAVADAFEALQRRLHEVLQRRRGDVKAHSQPSL